MRRCVCTVAWLLLVAVTTAQAERLPIRGYTVEDGLAHARVRRIVRDARGFLWFCTIDGLSRFDGTGRAARNGRRPADPPGQLFSPVPFEGPPTQHQVRVLLEDQAGRVWA